MAISNELSSEIAAAILAEKKTPQELGELKDVVLRVHTTLQQMSEEVKAQRSENRLRRSSASSKSDST
jgi:predicted transcriptional regulator